jgi:hypothetical protein
MSFHSWLIYYARAIDAAGFELVSGGNCDLRLKHQNRLGVELSGHSLK